MLANVRANATTGLRLPSSLASAITWNVVITRRIMLTPKVTKPKCRRRSPFSDETQYPLSA